MPKYKITVTGELPKNPEDSAVAERYLAQVSRYMHDALAEAKIAGADIAPKTVSLSTDRCTRTIHPREHDLGLDLTDVPESTPQPQPAPASWDAELDTYARSAMQPIGPLAADAEITAVETPAAKAAATAEAKAKGKGGKEKP